MPKMLRLNGLTEYWKGLSGRIWNVEDDGTTCDILISRNYKDKIEAVENRQPLFILEHIRRSDIEIAIIHLRAIILRHIYQTPIVTYEYTIMVEQAQTAF